jgi:hypothetical protein
MDEERVVLRAMALLVGLVSHSDVVDEGRKAKAGIIGEVAT